MNPSLAVKFVALAILTTAIAWGVSTWIDAALAAMTPIGGTR